MVAEAKAPVGKITGHLIRFTRGPVTHWVNAVHVARWNEYTGRADGAQTIIYLSDAPSVIVDGEPDDVAPLIVRALENAAMREMKS